MIGVTKSRLDNLLGNSIIQSAFRILFGCLGAEAKMVTILSHFIINLSFSDNFIQNTFIFIAL